MDTKPHPLQLICAQLNYLGSLTAEAREALMTEEGIAEPLKYRLRGYSHMGAHVQRLIDLRKQIAE